MTTFMGRMAITSGMRKRENHRDQSEVDSKSAARRSAWREATNAPSLPEVFGSIHVPKGGPMWRRLFAFLGPGYMIAVGYMDPGNWATDIAGGSAYSYSLLWVVLVSSLMAIFLQALSAKLGIVTGKDLAQACRDSYSQRTSILLWISAEIGIVACDIAEVIGAGIALNLLFGIPLATGVAITAADVLIVLALQSKGFRWLETFVITLIGTMMVIFTLEIVYASPNWLGVSRGLIPTSGFLRDRGMLYISLGILGATVMPHNLYLHSSIIQTRRFGKSVAEIRDSIRMAHTDSTIALTLAFLVNAAILILAAAVFYRSGNHQVDDITKAYKLLTPLMGVSIATPLFAIALLASGQNSTLTGTLAGQVVLEGFLRVKLKPWLRRMISRVLAIAPALAAVLIYGKDGVGSLMLFSQVVLSAQLSFAVIPLVQFTSDKGKMGEFANSAYVRWIGWAVAIVIAALNLYIVGAYILGGPPS